MLDQLSTDELLEALSQRLATAPEIPEDLARKIASLNELLVSKRRAQREGSIFVVKEDASQWIKQIKARYLNGKFNANWKINGVPVVSEKEQDSFKSIAVVGGGEDQLRKNGIQWKVVNLINDLGSESRDANWLVVSQPSREIGRNLGLEDGDYSALSYITWSHADFTNDSRGHHLPLEFVFFLPSDGAASFASQTETNPYLPETLFQRLHPGLTGDQGLRRVITDKLRIVQSSEQLIEGINKNGFRERLPIREVRYPTPLGEQSIARIARI